MRLSVALYLLSACSAVSAWPKWLPELDALVVRQDDSSPEESEAPSRSITEAPESTTGRNLNTAKPISGSEVSGSLSAEPTRTDFGNDPVGQVVMVTPAATLGTHLYKIGDFVTLGWTYTDLQAKPSAIDLILSCAEASETWTLTSNMTFETAGSYTWDSREQETAVESPLLTEMYTLIVIDAESDVSATPEAGYLAAFSGFTFGMYEPVAYTPLADWTCPTCNSAPAGLDRHALGFAALMSAISVLSFTWFVTGLGVSL